MQPPLSFPHVYGLAVNAGFSPTNAVIATAIVFAESSGIPDNVHINSDQWNSTDWGLAQINDHWQADKFAKYPDLKTDPKESMYAMHDIFVESNSNFTAWSTFQSGNYARYLTQAQTASKAPASETGAVDTLTKLQAIANAMKGKPFQGSTVATAVVVNNVGATGQYVLATTVDGKSYALYPDGHVSQTGGANSPVPPHFNWFQRLFNISPVIPGADKFGQGNQAMEQAYHNISTGPININENPVSDAATAAVNAFDLGAISHYLWIGGGALLVVLALVIMAKGEIPTP